MPTLRFAAALVIALSVGACADLDAEPIVVTVRVAPGDVAPLPEMDRVLRGRLARLQHSLFGSFAGERRGNALVYTFRAQRIPRATIERQVATRGELRVHPTAEPAATWYSEADVVDANASADEHGYTVNLTLAEEAGARVAQLSADAIGQQVDFVWDGDVLMSATVRGQMGRRMSISQLERDQALLMTGIVGFGSLPVPIADYRIESAQFE